MEIFIKNKFSLETIPHSEGPLKFASTARNNASNNVFYDNYN